MSSLAGLYADRLSRLQAANQRYPIRRVDRSLLRSARGVRKPIAAGRSGDTASTPSDEQDLAMRRPTVAAGACLLLPALVGLGFASEHGECNERTPIPQAGAGPHDYSPAPADGCLWRDGDEGEQLFLRARVLDTCSTPVIGALVKLRHANHAGQFLADRRADIRTDARGELRVLTVLPGFAGGLPRHMHFIISHPDYRRLVTRVYFKGDPAARGESDDLAIVLEEVRRGESIGCLGNHEFVLVRQ